MTDTLIHEVQGGGLITLALACVLAFLRILAALGELAVHQKQMHANEQAIADKLVMSLPHPPKEK